MGVAVGQRPPSFPDVPFESCPVCRGDGFIGKYTELGVFSSKRRCVSCRGTGKVKIQLWEYSVLCELQT